MVVTQINSSEAMHQAKMTAHDYMLSAKLDIDKIFGDGFATKHPELVGQYMVTAAIDFHAYILARLTDEIELAGANVNHTLTELGDAHESS